VKTVRLMSDHPVWYSVRITSKRLLDIAYNAVTRIELGTGMSMQQFNASLRRKVNLQNIMGIYKFMYGM
jgi:hypothetical protein